MGCAMWQANLHRVRRVIGCNDIIHDQRTTRSQWCIQAVRSQVVVHGEDFTMSQHLLTCLIRGCHHDQVAYLQTGYSFIHLSPTLIHNKNEVPWSCAEHSMRMRDHREGTPLIAQTFQCVQKAEYGLVDEAARRAPNQNTIT